MKFEKFTFLLCLIIFCIAISCKKKEDTEIKKSSDSFNRELVLYNLAEKKYTRLTQSPTFKEFGFRFTADDKQIVFNTRSGLFMINIDGTDLKKIDNEVYERILSPDGNYFAFIKEEKLFLMDFDGGNIRQISPDSVIVVKFQWLRNSKKIAYFKLNKYKSYEYYVNADGISIVDLQGDVDNLKIDGTFYDVILPLEESYDSKYIGYIKDNYNGNMSNIFVDFYVYDLINHKERKVKQNLNEIVFSPTRPEIMYSLRTGYYARTTDLFFADMKNTVNHLLQIKEDFAFGFSFSPDGNKLAFLEDLKLTFIDRTGANYSKIDELSKIPGPIIWSHDGKYVLVYLENHDKNDTNIY